MIRKIVGRKTFNESWGIDWKLLQEIADNFKVYLLKGQENSLSDIEISQINKILKNVLPDSRRFNSIIESTKEKFPG